MSDYQNRSLKARYFDFIRTVFCGFAVVLLLSAIFVAVLFAPDNANYGTIVLGDFVMIFFALAAGLIIGILLLENFESNVL
jgi:hypothetical protein